MHVAYSLTKEDLLEFLRFSARHDRAYRGPRVQTLIAIKGCLLSFAALAGMTGLLALYDLRHGRAVGASSALVGILLLLFLWVLVHHAWLGGYDRSLERRFRTLIESGEFGTPGKDESLSIGQDGLTFRNERGEGRLYWGSGVEAVAATPGLVLLHTCASRAFAIPKRAFASTDAVAQFVQASRGHIKASGGSPRLEALRARLAERDTPCPECRYNLRGVESDRCPECGFQFAIADFKRP